MRQQIALLLLTLLFGAAQVRAAESKAAKSSGGSGVYFDETFVPKIVERNDTQTYPTSPGTATESGMGFDTKTTLGYIFGGAWFVGATYNNYSLTTSRPNRESGSASIDESTDLTYMGPTLGWFAGGWKVLLTAVISGEKVVHTKNKDATTVTGDVKFTNKEGTGTQLAAGYAFPVASNFSIGPTLVYRSLTFAKQSKVNKINNSAAENYTNTKLFNAAIDSSLDIMISLSVRF